MDYVDYLMKFIGRPYIWGGDGTSVKCGGFDCSGLVLEGLWAFGLYKGGDTTAEGIRAHYKANGREVLKKDLQRGDLVFFGTSKATHVAIALGEGLMLEAGGGSSKSVSLDTSTGFVSVRPIARRKDYLVGYRL